MFHLVCGLHASVGGIAECSCYELKEANLAPSRISPWRVCASGVRTLCEFAARLAAMSIVVANEWKGSLECCRVWVLWS